MIVAGTISACLLTLVLLPVMYQQYERLVARFGPTVADKRLGGARAA